MEIVQNLFRTLMFFLDNIVYGLIPQIYRLFVYLSELNLYGGENNPIQTLIGRVYVLLGIFMLFKVSFSLLQYIVDPSAFRDSSKGMGKLVTNVLVALVLLVSVPTIFNFATEVQTTVVKSNVIGELILGESMSDGDGEMSPQKIEMLAKDVQFMMFGAFYSLNPAVTEGENAMFSECAGTSGVFGSKDMALANNGGCLEQLNEEISKYDDASANGVNLYSFFKHAGGNGDACLNGTCDTRDFSHFDKLLWWKSDGEYVINYLPFISTAAGIYVVFLLITFCVDVAVRVIKLCFLQMIAPIAIVSYIDPKESVSSGKLSSWIKEVVSTYFSLFLRLATLFLVMLLISVISSMVLAKEGELGAQIAQITGNDVGFNIWIYLFLIIGAFMFAGKVPKLIESIFGIKGSGEFSLNPFKNQAVAAGTGMLIGGAAGVSSGLRAGAMAGAPVRGAVGGLLSGTRQGFGTKLSPDMYRNIRKSTYKDFTGNDLATFNPYQRLMGIGGEKKVDEIKTPLNEAREQLNNAQTRLGVLSRITSENGTVLRQRLSAEQLSNLSKTKEEYNKRQLGNKSKLDSLKAQKESLISARNEAQKQVDQISGRMNSGVVLDNKTASEYRAQREKLMSDISRYDQNINSTDSQIKDYQTSINNDNEIISAIDNYVNATREENQLRSEIGAIEKDISTLSDEKAQRQRFYGIESSPKQDVSDAIGHINERNNSVNNINNSNNGLM